MGEILWGINERIFHMAWKIIWTKGQERWLRQVGKGDLRIWARGIWSRANLWNYSKKRIPCQLQKVKRSMNEQNLFSANLRYQRCLTESCKSRGEGFSNLLKTFQALSSDITYIPTDEGFDYTCMNRDIKTGIILTEKTADRMKKGLILATVSSI